MGSNTENGVFGHQPFKKKTLLQRRVEAADKFSNKCLANPRLERWFPYKTIGIAGIKCGEVFLDEHERCNRLRDSSVFFMRRQLNGKDGKTYGQHNK